MAATVTAYPPGPASVYRPMPLKVKRTDPSGSAIAWIKVANATDVSTYGNGLQVGQVFIQHATIQGSVPMQAGQTLHIYQNGGPYLGVWTCINSWGTGTVYTIIDAPAMGGFTPSGSPTSALRVYLDNYTIFAKVLIYTTPTGTPQQVVLRARPSDAAGNAIINVDVVLRDYFDHRPVMNGLLPYNSSISLNGLTAIHYRLHVVEVWSGPASGSADPFDGSHDIFADDTGDILTMRTAVNAVHPYASDVITWMDADMSAFQIGVGTKVLTLAPRGMVQGPGGAIMPGVRLLSMPGDTLYVAMLTDMWSSWSFEGKVVGRFIEGENVTPEQIAALGAGISANVYNTAAFAFPVGPGNLGAMVTGMSRYSVWLVDVLGTVMSEPVEVHVDLKCREGGRRFAWLNKLGGIDAHTFTGREIFRSKVKRATVRKPYGAGTGYDWTERTYRAEPERTRTVSTKPLPVEYRRWLAEDMAESANVVAIEGGRVVPVILLTDEAVGGDTSPVGSKPFTVDYRLGVDNLSQQA